MNTAQNNESLRLYCLAGAADIVNELLQGDGGLSARDLVEAAVYRPKRGRIYVASFTGAVPGTRVWRSTGQCDYHAALRLAKQWERAAREQRTKHALAPRPPLLRVGRRFPGGLTQEEVAAVLEITTRAVARAEKTAVEKLRRNPVFRQLARDYLGLNLEESVSNDQHPLELDAFDIMALRGLAQTESERRALGRVLALASSKG